MGISENFLTIADNTDDVIEVVSSAQKQVQGPYIKVDDVSNIEHNVPCRVESKNIFLFKQGYVSGGTGKVIESLENGAICQGVLTSSAQNISWGNGWYTFGNRATVNLKAGDVVTVSCDYTVLELADGHSMDDFNSNDRNKKVGIYLYNSGSGSSYTGSAKNQPAILGEPIRLYTTYTVAEDSNYYPLFTLNSNKVKVENIQIEYGSTATPYTPYITDFSQVEVSRYGKNLYDISKGLYKDILVDNGDGSYTLTKTNNGAESNLVSCYIPANTDITLSVDVIEYTGTWWTPFPVYFYYDDGTNTAYWLISVNNWDSTKIRTFKTTKNIIGFKLVYPGTNDLGTYTKFKDFQIELGTTGTTYEPFKGIETYQSTAEGIVDGVTSIAPNMTLLTNADGVVISARYFPQGTEKMCTDFKKLKTALQDAEKLFKEV